MRIPRPILERRRSVRVEEALPFKIGHEGFEFETTSANIGYHGALCLMEKEIPLMTRVRIGIVLPREEIQLSGVVVRRAEDPVSGKFRTAIFFSNIKPKDAQALRAFIDARLRSKSE